jgi:hypothetical protein
LALAVARHIADYFDLLVAAVLAIVFSYLGIHDTLKGDELAQATIALLGVLAIVIFRERWERRAAVDGIQQALTVVDESYPWRVLDEEAVWDIQSTDGSRALATLRRDMMLTLSESFVIYEFRYHQPNGGTVADHRCFGKTKDGAEQSLPIIQDDFEGKENRIYRLISLRRPWKRGEVLSFRSERDLVNYFPGDRETVSKEVAVPTARVRLSVMWPASRKPKALWLERSATGPKPVNLLEIRKKDGRPTYRTTINDPQLGERIIIRWDW